MLVVRLFLESLVAVTLTRVLCSFRGKNVGNGCFQVY